MANTWVDGENKYDIKTQGDVVIQSDVKLVYKGATGTALSAQNLNAMSNAVDSTALTLISGGLPSF